MEMTLVKSEIMTNYQELPYLIRKIWRWPHIAVGVELFVSDQMEDHMRLAEVAVLRQVEITRAQPFTLLPRLHGCKNKKLEVRSPVWDRQERWLKYGESTLLLDLPRQTLLYTS